MEPIETAAARALDAQRVELQCAACNHVFSMSVGWLRANGRGACPACATVLPIDNAKIRASFENAMRSISELRETLPADIPITLKF